jgi:hypothetical protein
MGRGVRGLDPYPYPEGTHTHDPHGCHIPVQIPMYILFYIALHYHVPVYCNTTSVKSMRIMDLIYSTISITSYTEAWEMMLCGGYGVYYTI